MNFENKIDYTVGIEFFDWTIERLKEIPDAGQKEVMLLEDDKMLILKLKENRDFVNVTNEKRKVIEIVTTCERISKCIDDIIDQIQKIKGDA